MASGVAGSGLRAPIGVFDSGLGGLTVVAALRRRLPGEHIVYFGDTARVPYGSKSPETVTRFALENCKFLRRFRPKLIVAACNTASAASLDALREALPIPVCGVVEPGAAAAVHRARTTGRKPAAIAVVATESTVASCAYPQAIRRLDPTLPVSQRPCPLLVPLVEEGRSPSDPIVRLTLTDYLGPLAALEPSVVLLGCTHYPLLADAVADVMGQAVAVVDSAQATASTVAHTLAAADLLSDAADGGTLRCYVSDNPQRFTAIGSRFLGEPLGSVAWISPDQFLGLEPPTIRLGAARPDRAIRLGARLSEQARSTLGSGDG